MYEKEKKFIIECMTNAYKTFADENFSINQKSKFDLVTDLDMNIEKYLTEKINQTFPNDVILGEEFSANQTLEGRTWTIDPIDGTCNMASGMPLFGVQCSLIENNEIVLAAIYLPKFNEVIYAIKGNGCYLNDKQVFVDKSLQINNAIVSFGDYPHTSNYKFAKIQHSAINSLYSQIAKIRMFGSACIDFSFVGLARTSACVVITKNLWDIAPGVLIAQEAGAIITNLKGETYHFGDDGVVASCSEELSNLIIKNLNKNLVLNIDENIHFFDACIFDLDGVVIDSEKFHFKAWEQAFESIGTKLSYTEYIPLMSSGRKNVIAFCESKLGRNLQENEKIEMLKIKDVVYKNFIDNCNSEHTILGVTKFIDYLYNKGIKIAVASSSVFAKSILAKLSLDTKISICLDGNSPVKTKPAPDIYLESAKMLGVDYKNCLVFEDSVNGVNAGINAGMKVVCVGNNDKSILNINNFNEIFDYID